MIREVEYFKGETGADLERAINEMAAVRRESDWYLGSVALATYPMSSEPYKALVVWERKQ